MALALAAMTLTFSHRFSNGESVTMTVDLAPDVPRFCSDRHLHCELPIGEFDWWVHQIIFPEVEQHLSPAQLVACWKLGE